MRVHNMKIIQKILHIHIICEYIALYYLRCKFALRIGEYLRNVLSIPICALNILSYLIHQAIQNLLLIWQRSISLYHHNLRYQIQEFHNLSANNPLGRSLNHIQFLLLSYRLFLLLWKDGWVYWDQDQHSSGIPFGDFANHIFARVAHLHPSEHTHKGKERELILSSFSLQYDSKITVIKNQ